MVDRTSLPYFHLKPITQTDRQTQTHTYIHTALQAQFSPTVSVYSHSPFLWAFYIHQRAKNSRERGARERKRKGGRERESEGERERERGGREKERESIYRIGLISTEV